MSRSPPCAGRTCIYNKGSNNITIRNSMDLFFFFMGVWCGFVAAVRYGERFDFLLKLRRRPVVCVYYTRLQYIRTYIIRVYLLLLLFKRIRTYPTRRRIRKCLPGSPSDVSTTRKCRRRRPVFYCARPSSDLRPPGRHAGRHL
ncbi:unnamed protein product [Aphis gossypii]|uniref:Uncharacterized protein n=1 Tax=Aphis gossypii TaxID=80765 RepID=A0A9P0JEA3_APHGO|nr:unnamed protein product [Aphis gossypii]